MLSFDANNIHVLNIYGAEYCCIIFGISKNKAICTLKSSDFGEKSWPL